MPPTNANKPKKATKLELKLMAENNELRSKLALEVSVSRLNPKMNALEYNWVIDQLAIIKETYDNIKPLPEKVEIIETEPLKVVKETEVN